jgi:hypothetical protein
MMPYSCPTPAAADLDLDALRSMEHEPAPEKAVHRGAGEELECARRRSCQRNVLAAFTSIDVPVQ